MREEKAKSDISKSKKTLRDSENAERKAEATEQKIAQEKPKGTDLSFKKLEKKAEKIAKGEAIDNSGGRSRHRGVSIRHETTDNHSDVHITIDKSAFNKSES